ncbi:MAG: ATP-binding protein, partial [Methanosarcinales archaeon]
MCAGSACSSAVYSPGALSTARSGATPPSGGGFSTLLKAAGDDTNNPLAGLSINAPPPFHGAPALLATQQRIVTPTAASHADATLVNDSAAGAARSRGTGFGLPISRMIARHMGGRLRLYRDEDRQATVYELELYSVPQAMQQDVAAVFQTFELDWTIPSYNAYCARAVNHVGGIHRPGAGPLLDDYAACDAAVGDNLLPFVGNSSFSALVGCFLPCYSPSEAAALSFVDKEDRAAAHNASSIAVVASQIKAPDATPAR